MQRLADRDQVPLDRSAHDPVLAKTLRAHFIADRDDLLGRRKRIEEIDADLTLLHRTASGRE